MRCYRNAFTLAEILVTLAIIGIVAAYTIPALIVEHEKTVYVTSLKKFYASFSQSLQQKAANNGCYGSLSCTGVIGITGASSEKFGNEIVKVMNVSKNCGISQNDYCWANPISTAYHLDNDESTINTGDSYKFITADGMSVSITANSSIDANGIIGSIRVDVNGKKKPNRMGRDVFIFVFENNGALFPLYYDKYNNYNEKFCRSTPSPAWGTGCSANIMKDGWKMSY